ncbi:MAG TPA: rhomboid family intramembrane serine protease [Candidatus Sulfotelmatobacter sp.]|jgi:membrane associated rhomboid family serine protease|nr:rhomboid family intramembrane serine protease [Candidatus Sulfotelmatobacter sp.]
MLEDRDYMREPDYGSGWPRRFGVRWSLTMVFLVTYAAVFLVQLLLERISPGINGWYDWYEYHFALSNAGLSHGYVWQLVTYQFMHANFLHLFFNGWAIYIFGLAIESDLGPRRFAALMFSSGIIGGVVQSLVMFVWPAYFGGAVVGASACAFGLIAAYAALYPTRELQLLLFFVIPVTLTARTLLIVSLVIALVGFGLRLGNVAHAAHLGGMAMGWAFVRVNWKRFLPSKKDEFASPRRPTRLEVYDAPDQSTEREVDAILDKISAHGIKSLTAREREILEAARKKL